MITARQFVGLVGPGAAQLGAERHYEMVRPTFRSRATGFRDLAAPELARLRYERMDAFHDKWLARRLEIEGLI